MKWFLHNFDRKLNNPKNIYADNFLTSGTEGSPYKSCIEAYDLQ